MITPISILGSTGSIGTQTLEVVRQHPTKFSIVALAAGSNISLLRQQILEFSPQVVSVKDEQAALALKDQLKKQKIEILIGEEGNIAVATHPASKRVVIASPGLPSLKPTIEAIKHHKIIALATKEVLVSAGELVTSLAQANQTPLLPIDSEHSAIFQCLEGKSLDQISQVHITCSGGPFRGYSKAQLKKVNLTQALAHPNWKMGQKITIDSATLMNKGFEVIEAHYLFNIPYQKIKVIVHPQSVIHSAVEFVDGSIMAQLGPADMRLPIQYALFYPAKRQPNNFKRFQFESYPTLTFEQPDLKTFRCLKLAYQVGELGGTSTAVLSAANDVAVANFLEGKIQFYKIPEILEQTLEKHHHQSNPSLEQILEADSWARSYANSQL